MLNKAKKILFIVTQSEFGGAQHFLAHLVTALDKNKYDVLVAAGPEGNNKSGLLYFLEKKRINTKHLRFLRRAVNPIFDFLGLFEIFKLIKKEKPDTIFLCSSKAGVLGSFAAWIYFRVNLRSYLRKSARPKVIYRIGGWTFNDPHSFLWKVFYRFIEKISAKWKDVIIVNAECHRRQAIELGIKPKEGILTVYNGIDAGKLDFLPREKALEELIKNVSNYMIIGTIANLYPSKGLEYLIEAANMLRKRFVSVKFIVIGEGEERERLKNLIKKYNLENNFFFAGAIPEAYKYLKAFDVFVLPSVKEGFPWVILEAMAAEVPIVATRVGAIPEIQPGLLVEPGNVEELSHAIIEVLEDYSLRTQMVKNAKKVVEEKFSLEKMVKEIERLL